MREVERAREQGRDILPFRDELFVQRIELVERGEAIFLPIPLHHRRLEQRGRRVAIEFEQLRLALPVISQIEPAEIERGRLRFPRIADRRGAEIGDAEGSQQRGPLDDILPGLKQQLVEFGGRAFDPADLIAGEAVKDAFVPIRLAVRTMPDQPLRLDPRLPVGARGDAVADHPPNP